MRELRKRTRAVDDRQDGRLPFCNNSSSDLEERRCSVSLAVRAGQDRAGGRTRS